VEIALQPGAYQQHISRTGREQRDRERDMQGFARGVEIVLMTGKHRAILAMESRTIFWGDS